MARKRWPPSPPYDLESAKDPAPSPVGPRGDESQGKIDGREQIGISPPADAERASRRRTGPVFNERGRVSPRRRSDPT